MMFIWFDEVLTKNLKFKSLLNLSALKMNSNHYNGVNKVRFKQKILLENILSWLWFLARADIRGMGRMEKICMWYLMCYAGEYAN